MYGGADLTSLCPQSKQVVKNRYQTSTQKGRTNSGEWEKHAPRGCPSHLLLQSSLWWNVFSTKGLTVWSPSFRQVYHGPLGALRTRREFLTLLGSTSTSVGVADTSTHQQVVGWGVDGQWAPLLKTGCSREAWKRGI